MTPQPLPTYGPTAIHALGERTKYETWLLEEIYELLEQEMFPGFPDEVIYPLGSSVPEFMTFMRANIVLGDWRRCPELSCRYESVVMKIMRPS